MVERVARIRPIRSSSSGRRIDHHQRQRLHRACAAKGHHPRGSPRASEEDSRRAGAFRDQQVHWRGAPGKEPRPPECRSGDPRGEQGPFRPLPGLQGAELPWSDRSAGQPQVQILRRGRRVPNGTSLGRRLWGGANASRWTEAARQREGQSGWRPAPGQERSRLSRQRGSCSYS